MKKTLTLLTVIILLFTGSCNSCESHNDTEMMSEKKMRPAINYREDLERSNEKRKTIHPVKPTKNEISKSLKIPSLEVNLFFEHLHHRTVVPSYRQTLNHLLI